MTSLPMFTVVIPTHNRVELVERALKSVYAQTLNDYEIVVVDDGSTDGTRAFLEGVRSDRCLTLRNDVSVGVSRARNRGVAAATGEFVAFLDDDDELRPSALASLHNRCCAFPQVDFLWGGRMIHEKDDAGHIVDTREDDWTHVKCPLRGSEFLPFVLEIATSTAFTIRRKVFEKLGGFDEQLKVSEDRDLFISLAEHGYLGAPVPHTLIDIDGHRNSLTQIIGLRIGPEMDLIVINKHRSYLERPEHSSFMNTYLLEVFEYFLHRGNRRSAARILMELRRRHALNSALVRKILRRYVRHAPEFRTIKALLLYNTIRRLKYRLWRAA